LQIDNDVLIESLNDPSSELIIQNSEGIIVTPPSFSISDFAEDANHNIVADISINSSPEIGEYRIIINCQGPDNSKLEVGTTTYFEIIDSNTPSIDVSISHAFVVGTENEDVKTSTLTVKGYGDEDLSDLSYVITQSGIVVNNIIDSFEFATPTEEDDIYTSITEISIGENAPKGTYTIEIRGSQASSKAIVTIFSPKGINAYALGELPNDPNAKGNNPILVVQTSTNANLTGINIECIDGPIKNDLKNLFIFNERITYDTMRL
jgi:hypothetical protein